MWEDSQTDFYLSRFIIECQCVINSNYLPLLAPSLVNAAGVAITTNPADIQNIIYQKLMTPRSTLSLTMNGVNLIPTSLGGGTPDAKSGPQPQRCVFTALTNTSFILTWSCIAHYWVNNTQAAATSATVTNTPGNKVLYNRWSEVQEIDNCNRSTYTRSGKFVIRSDNPEGKIVDEMRNQMAVVGVRPSFLRKSSRYAVDKSGLALEYIVVDHEVFKKPPSPAFEANGEYTESVGRMAPYRLCTATVRLKGSNQTDQMSLVETAVKVVAAKLRLRGGQFVALAGGDEKAGIATLESARLMIKMYDNEVEFTAQAMIGAGATETILGTFNAFSTANTVTPYHEENYQPDYKSRGSANILLHAAAYYDPSLAGTGVNDDGFLTTGKEPGEK